MLEHGSTLSPMLVNIYMKSVGEIVRRFGLHSHKYADDAQLYLAIPSDLKEEVVTPNLGLEAVMD